jgi:hypothetical protein
MIKESIQHKDTILEILYASDNVSSTYMKPKLSEEKGAIHKHLEFLIHLSSVTDIIDSKKYL